MSLSRYRTVTSWLSLFLCEPFGRYDSEATMAVVQHKREGRSAGASKKTQRARRLGRRPKRADPSGARLAKPLRTLARTLLAVDPKAVPDAQLASAHRHDLGKACADPRCKANAVCQALWIIEQEADSAIAVAVRVLADGLYRAANTLRHSAKDLETLTCTLDHELERQRVIDDRARADAYRRIDDRFKLEPCHEHGPAHDHRTLCLAPASAIIAIDRLASRLDQLEQKIRLRILDAATDRAPRGVRGSEYVLAAVTQTLRTAFTVREVADLVEPPGDDIAKRMARVKQRLRRHRKPLYTFVGHR